MTRVSGQGANRQSRRKNSEKITASLNPFAGKKSVLDDPQDTQAKFNKMFTKLDLAITKASLLNKNLDAALHGTGQQSDSKEGDKHTTKPVKTSLSSQESKNPMRNLHNKLDVSSPKNDDNHANKGKFQPKPPSQSKPADYKQRRGVKSQPRSKQSDLNSVGPETQKLLSRRGKMQNPRTFGHY